MPCKGTVKPQPSGDIWTLRAEYLPGFIFKTLTGQKKALLPWMTATNSGLLLNFDGQGWHVLHAAGDLLLDSSATKFACELARSRWWPKTIAAWLSTYQLGWYSHFRANCEIYRGSKCHCVCAHRSCCLLPRFSSLHRKFSVWLSAERGESLSWLDLYGNFQVQQCFFLVQSRNIWRVIILRVKKPYVGSSSWGCGACSLSSKQQGKGISAVGSELRGNQMCRQRFPWWIV